MDDKTNTFSSEALQAGIVPPENCTEEEFEKFRESLDADSMGFYGKEGADV